MFNHMALSVVDLQKSEEFYRDVIGLEQIPEPFKVGKHAWFKVSEHGQLHIIAKSEGIRKHDRNTHLCFSVPSMGDFIARLEKMNVNYADLQGNKKPQTRPDGVQQIYLQDPDGYWLEINDDYPDK